MGVLVTGGAGYIGAHVVELLRERGDDVVIVDDLVTGLPSRVTGVPLIELDLSRSESVATIAEILQERGVEAVIHFAARKQVGESVAHPARYFRDNLGGLANLLLAMEQAGTRRIVFSSSASVYGGPDAHPVFESTPTEPINPYGETKLFGEKLLADAQRAGTVDAVSLRYFNVAGAGSAELSDRVALNLIPMVIERIVAGEAPRIFGSDYPTPDGTCVRDYVHVVDLAEAHLAAVDALAEGRSLSPAYNIGTGTGSSVAEVIREVCRVAQVEYAPVIEPRRPGDPADLVGAVGLAREELGWQARHSLADMVSSAWEAATELRREVRL